MIETHKHKIGEKFSLITDATNSSSIVIRRSHDGKVFNTFLKTFENRNEDGAYKIPLQDYPGAPQLKHVPIDFLPTYTTDILIEYLDASDSSLSFERHIFGVYQDLTAPNICVVYGTVINPSGKPIQNARVEAYLNRSGFFIDKTPLMGPTTNALTNEAGYFELPLLQGIEVTINIPEISFTTSGYVPLVNSVKLSPYCLLSSTTKKASMVR